MASVSLLALHLLQVPVHLQDSADQVNVGFDAGQVCRLHCHSSVLLCAAKFCQATEMVVLSAAAPCFE